MTGLHLTDLQGLDVIELADDRVRRAVLGIKGTQERRGGNLGGLVDANRQHILLGNGAFDPGSSLRDDAATVQRTVAFLDFNQEIHAGRTVELADDDAFGAVDDELAAADHDRHFTQVYRILDHLGPVLALEPDPNPEGHAKGQPQRAAFIRRVASLRQFITEILQLQIPVIRLDREDLPKQCFEAFVLALGRINFLL